MTCPCCLAPLSSTAPPKACCKIEQMTIKFVEHKMKVDPSWAGMDDYWAREEYVRHHSNLFIFHENQARSDVWTC